MPLAPPTGIPLAQFLGAIGQTVADAHGGAHWILAEIVSASPRAKGYWVLEIQDTDAKGAKSASASVMVWYREVHAVINYFKRATGQDLGPGMRVMLLVEVGLDPNWGFRMTAKGIDPSWTVGQAAQELDRIRARLRGEGIWEQNRALPAPRDFTRVAVIAPDGSAGLGDFWAEARMLHDAGVCQFELHSAAFEGPNAVRDIPAVFSLIRDELDNPQGLGFDAVFVVRGGGASSGLNNLNQEAIIRAVCTCPVPVIIGIGHEKDTTLLDEVAHTVLGTPSKAVGHLASRVVGNARTAMLAWQEIRTGTRARLREADQQVNRLIGELRQGRALLLRRAGEEVAGLLREAMGLGPAATLGRGYAMVSHDGTVVKTAAEAKTATEVELVFADGRVPARIEPPA